MKVIYTEDFPGHNPKFEFDHGKIVKAWETPERALIIKESLLQLPFISLEKVSKNFDYSYAAAIHDVNYINWLKKMSLDLSNNEALYPSVFPFCEGQKIPNNKASVGQFCFDTYTPIFRDTFIAAWRSVETALQAAECVSSGKDKFTYGLCRPPGHHAENRKYGGYSYFNNTSIAADYLTKQGAKVAVLDVDVHHGNGTQNAFWEREDVLTISIHCDPNYLFPYFSGYKDEIGTGAGLGKNYNYPLTPNTNDDEYQITLETALEIISTYSPDFLVIALGVDTHKDDPLGNFGLTTSYFSKMASTIKQIGCPSLIIQEGGYSLENVGESVVAFLSPFNS